MTVLRQYTHASVVALMALAAFGMSTAPSAAQEKVQNTSEKTQKEIHEALVSVKDYSIAKRDEFMKTAKSAIGALDQRIEHLQAKLDDQSDESKAEVKQTWKDTLVELRTRRIAIAEQYGALRQSSKTAWDKLKEGFFAAYDEAADAVDEAEKAF